MANNFLDKFRSGMKAVQSRQLMALLTREKENGNITTVEEFKQRLNELTARLSATTISPTLELFLAEVGEVIDTDTFNFMLERIQDDLESAFAEANDIDAVLESHETIINDVVLKNLELAVNDLESRIESLEFINGTGLGFDNAVFNTFRVTQNNRSSFDQGVIFVDPKTGIQSGPSAEAFIDFIGEKLILRNSLQKENRIASIRQIFDAEAKQSEVIVEFPNSSLDNILDQKVGTFWTQSVLLSKHAGDTGVFTKLELDLGSVQTINFLQLEPILMYPVDLYRISYIDENNQSKTILSTPVEFSGTRKLFFNTISTRKIQIVFRNKNFGQVQFEVKPHDPIVTIQREPLNPSALLQSIQGDLLEVVSSPRVKAALTIGNNADVVQKKLYEYFIGFDNIRVGLAQFDETSVFVSKSEKVEKLGQAAAKVLDKRAVSVASGIEYTEDTQPSSLDTQFHTSIEYYLLKRDFTADGFLINSFSVPVLPMNTTVIRHERLVLNKKSESFSTTNDIGTLQFYTSDDDIRVYRNGQLMTESEVSGNGWHKYDDESVDNPGQTTRMKYAIQVNNPNPTDIFTVSYTPDISTSNILPLDINSTTADMVDLSGSLDAWLGKDNLIFFPQTKRGITIAYSLVNFVIVLRRNSSNVTLTPVVEEYLLALGSKNNNKFGD